MIRFALVCDHDHSFESWFSSGESYDAQKARGLVECPVCGSGKVDKQLMSPALSRSTKHGAPVPNGTPPNPPPTPSTEVAVPVAPPQLALTSERDRALRAMLKEMRAHVTSTADYVGRGFAEEARKMHYGDVEHRSIYGEANLVEARALLEEGIEVQPIPTLPDERN